MSPLNVVLLVVYAAVLFHLERLQLRDGSLLRDAVVIFSAAARVVLVNMLGLNGIAGMRRKSVGQMLLSRLLAILVVVTIFMTKSGYAAVAGAIAGLMMAVFTSRHDMAALARSVGLLSQKSHDALFMPPPVPPDR